MATAAGPRVDPLFDAIGRVITPAIVFIVQAFSMVFLQAYATEAGFMIGAAVVGFNYSACRDGVRGIDLRAPGRRALGGAVQAGRWSVGFHAWRGAEMTDVIVNPRRVPRAPVRCEARCLLPGDAFWSTDTTDIGPQGCQLTSPGPQKQGDPVRLVLRSEQIVDPLIAEGRIAWTSPRPPWRLGVAFEDGYQQGAARWFSLLIAAYPGLESYHLAPDTIDLDARLYHGPIPRVPPELSPEEVLAIRSVGAGATPRALRDLLGEEWPAVEGALFAMVGKKLLTLDASEAGTPAAWTALLAKPTR